MLEGVNVSALREMVSIMPKDFDSIDGFKRVAGMLLGYDQSVGKSYIKEKQLNARANLTTKPILEAIIDGNDFTLLMEVDEDHFYTETLKSAGDNRRRYRWRGSDSEILDQLRALGNTMYNDHLNEVFTNTPEYKTMRSIAQLCYDDNETQERFKLWQGITDVNLDDVTPSTPLELARAIDDTVRQQTYEGGKEQRNRQRNNTLQGARALLYLDEKYPDQGITNMIEEYAEHFLINPPVGPRRAIDRLNRFLNSVLEYIRGSLQPNISK